MSKEKMLLFLVSAMRAIVEMLLLCSLAEGVLFFVAGKNRQSNPVYRFFALISRGPQQVVTSILPQRIARSTLAISTFLILALLWLCLAWLKQSLAVNYL
jgi:hypothetical protein